MHKTARTFLLRRWAWGLLAAAFLTAFGVALAIAIAIPLPGDDEFNVVHWELRHLPAKWTQIATGLFGDGLTDAEAEARLERYFQLGAQIRAAERSLNLNVPAQLDELAELRAEWNGLESDIERIMEGRVTAILEDAGLESSIPLFPGLRWVFPPVDFEVDEPLRVMTVSPRDQIVRLDRRSLRQGLTVEEVARLEAIEEADGTRSALAETVGGAATYPSIIAPQVQYERLAEIIAHEWVHQYLFFKPLGSRYFESQALTTFNETVANIAGRELAALLVERFPPPPSLVPTLDSESEPPPVDAGAVLRSLRLDVEELLALGEIEEAEGLMEVVRLELEEQGVFIRRINQAYFAARAVYADSPASIDPIGPKVQELRKQSESVGQFLRRAAELTSIDDLDLLVLRSP